MGAASITVDNTFATIECDENPFLITLKDARGSLTNFGAKSVFLSSLNPSGDLNRDGLQRNGEVELLSNAAMPLPPNVTKIHFQCADGEITKMWYTPIVN